MPGQDKQIVTADTRMLWRLAIRFLGDLEIAWVSGRPPEELRRLFQKLRDCLNELRLRGVQLEIDLREREQVPAARKVDGPVAEELD
jgi:hypothetical protein